MCTLIHPKRCVYTLHSFYMYLCILEAWEQRIEHCNPRLKSDQQSTTRQKTLENGQTFQREIVRAGENSKTELLNMSSRAKKTKWGLLQDWFPSSRGIVFTSTIMGCMVRMWLVTVTVLETLYLHTSRKHK